MEAPHRPEDPHPVRGDELGLEDGPPQGLVLLGPYGDLGVQGHHLVGPFLLEEAPDALEGLLHVHGV